MSDHYSNDVSGLFNLLNLVAKSSGGNVYDLLHSETQPIYSKKAGARTYYRFTRNSNNEYNYLTTVDKPTALGWFNTANTHVFSSDGTTFGNSFNYLRGSNNNLDAAYNPGDEAYLEKNNGGFVYKWTKWDNAYRGVSATLNIPQMQFKPSSNAANLNAYVYCAVQISIDSNNGYWAEICFMPSHNYQLYGHVAWALENGAEVGSGLAKSLGSSGISSGSSQEIKWRIEPKETKEGILLPYRFAIIIGGTEKGYLGIPDSYAGKTMSVRLMTGTSLVQNPPTNIMDIRNGGYMKKVEWLDCRVLTTGSPVEFYHTSAATDRVLVYNDAVCGARQISGSNKETINICYDGSDPWSF
jgi:hypothetical protein